MRSLPYRGRHNKYKSRHSVTWLDDRSIINWSYQSTFSAASTEKQSNLSWGFDPIVTWRLINHERTSPREITYKVIRAENGKTCSSSDHSFACFAHCQEICFSKLCLTGSFNFIFIPILFRHKVTCDVGYISSESHSCVWLMVNYNSLWLDLDDSLGVKYPKSNNLWNQLA